jgi:hypothetical protein
MWQPFSFFVLRIKPPFSRLSIGYNALTIDKENLPPGIEIIEK